MPVSDAVVSLLVTAIQKQTDEFSQSVEDLRDQIHGPRGSKGMFADKRETVQAAKRKMKIDKDTAESMVQYQNEVKKLAKLSKDGVIDQQEQMKALSDAFGGLENATEPMKKQFKRMQRELVQHGQIKQRDFDKTLLLARREAKARLANIDVTQKQIETTDRLLNAWDTASGAVHGAAKEFFSVRAATALLVSGIVRSFDEIEKAQRNQVAMYSILSGSMTDLMNGDFFQLSGARIGLTPEEAQDMVIANKNLIHSSGGVRQAFDAVNEMQDEMFRFTGSWIEANNAILGYGELFKKAGYDINFDTLAKTIGNPADKKSLTGALVGLQRLTGQSQTELQAQLGAMIETAEFQDELLALSARERRERVIGLAQRAKENALRGLSLDQMAAQEAARKRATAEGPRARLMNAIRMRQASNIAGMDPRKASEAMRIMMKSEAMRTEGEKKQLGEFAQNFNTVMTAELAKTMGGRNSVLEQMLSGPAGNIIQQMRDLGSSSRVLAESARQQDEAGANLTATLTGIEGPLATIQQLYKSMKATLADPVFSVTGGVISFVGQLAFQLMLLKGVALNAGTTVAGLVPTLAGVKTAMIGMAATAGNVVLAMAPFVALGYAVWNLYEALTKGESQVSRLVDEYLPGLYHWLGKFLNDIITFNWKGIGEGILTALSTMFLGIPKWIIQSIGSLFGVDPIATIKNWIFGGGESSTPTSPAPRSGSNNFAVAGMSEASRIDPELIAKVNEADTNVEKAALRAEFEEEMKRLRDNEQSSQQLIEQLVQMRAVMQAHLEIAKEAKDGAEENAAGIAGAIGGTLPASSPSSTPR